MTNLDEVIQSARQALAGHAIEDPGRLKLSRTVRRLLFRRYLDREAVFGVGECNQLARQTQADGAGNEFHGPDCLHSIGTYLYVRYERNETKSDLDDAIQITRQALNTISAAPGELFILAFMKGIPAKAVVISDYTVIHPG